MGRLLNLKMTDIHFGIRTESSSSHSGGGVQFTLAKVTHGRDQFAYGLHSLVMPSWHPGIRPQDFLEKLGFGKTGCPLMLDREAYCLAVDVDEDLSVASFADAFGSAFENLREADRRLQQCGFYLESRDFPAKSWARGDGDGHRGTNQKRMKKSNDQHFDFVFTWLQQGGNEG